MMNTLRMMAACLIALAAFASASSAFASPTSTESAMPHASPASTLFHCAWRQRFSHSVAWSGDLTFQVNSQGIIRGTYRSTSIRPDPFYGRIITVGGALSGKNIRLSFGISPSVSMHGTYEGKTITGTATVKSNSYEFAASAAK
jgi:hypothetical protein